MSLPNKRSRWPWFLPNKPPLTERPHSLDGDVPDKFKQLRFVKDRNAQPFGIVQFASRIIPHHNVMCVCADA